MPQINDQQRDAIRNVLKDSLSRLEGVATHRIDTYLDTVEADMIQIAALPPDQVDDAMNDLEVNAKGDLAILGIEAETEAARIALSGVRIAVGIVRAVLV